MNAWTVFLRNPLISALALLASVALIVVSETSYWQSRAAIERLTEGQHDRNALRTMHIGLLEAEIALRGYLLTGQDSTLQPFAGSVEAVTESLGELDRGYANARQLQPALVALREALKIKLHTMAQAIRLREQGQTEAAMALVAGDQRQSQTESLRTLTADLLTKDTQQREAHRAELQTALLMSRLGVACLSLIGLLALYFYLRHGLAAQNHQLELQRLAHVEQERLEVEVRRRTEQLTDLTHHLLSAREDERNRLARDLHDELGSLLTSAKLDAARLRSRLGDKAPEAQERLAHLVATLDSSIAMGRRIIEDLRPSTLANLGLGAAVEILAREFSERSGVRVHCALQPVALSANAELVVFRIVQEAITNLSKHAKASQAWISLAPRDGRVEVSVRDDGVGFDTTRPPTSAFGLLGMRYRVEAENGTLSLQSAPGQGTTVSVVLPESAQPT
jgi:signal transduction histidine kinase